MRAVTTPMSRVPTPAMVPPHHSGAPRYDLEHISSFPPRALGAKPQGRADFGGATIAPLPWLLLFQVGLPMHRYFSHTSGA